MKWRWEGAEGKLPKQSAVVRLEPKIHIILNKRKGEEEIPGGEGMAQKKEGKKDKKQGRSPRPKSRGETRDKVREESNQRAKRKH